MEDGHDFEFVVSDGAGMEEEDDLVEVHCEGNEPKGICQPGSVPEPRSISKEFQEVDRLKQHLQAQCSETTMLIQKLREQQTQLTNELKAVHNLKSALSDEQSQFAAQKQELSKLLESMASAPTNIAKSNHLVGELRKFYTETASIEAEVTKLKSMRAQQEELIKECKVNIETMASNQVR